MKRILVPVNHEAGSLLAVECAARIAGAFGATVDLVNIRESGHSGSADEQLEAATTMLATRAIEPSIMRAEGKVGVQLARVAEMADLVVMRTQAHRREGEDDAQVTSTTLEVLRRTPRPVIAVTERVTEMRHPIFAYNGSPQSRRAIKTALTMLTPEIVQKGTLVVCTSDEHMAERLYGEIDEVAEANGIRLKHYHASGKPAEVILSRLGEGGADMVVMGAIGRTWIAEKLFGSTTNRMLRSCPVPILMSR